MKRRYLVLTALFLFTGCGKWVLTSKTAMTVGRSLDCTFTPPENWFFLKESDRVTFSRNGIPLDMIQIRNIPYRSSVQTAGYSVPPTGTIFTKEMLMHDYPELLAHETAQFFGARFYEITAVTVDTVDGNDAVTSKFRFVGDDEVKRLGIITALPLAGGVKTILFTAPESYYFPTYQKEYETVVKTFALKK